MKAVCELIVPLGLGWGHLSEECTCTQTHTHAVTQSIGVTVWVYYSRIRSVNASHSLTWKNQTNATHSKPFVWLKRTLCIRICKDNMICTVSVPLKLRSRNLPLFLPILHFQLLTPSHLHTQPLKPNTLFPPLVSSPGGTLSGNDVMVNVSGFPLTFHAQHHHNYKDTTHTHAAIHVSITSHIIAPASLCMSVWTHTVHNTSVHTCMRTEVSIILLENLSRGLVVYYQRRHIFMLIYYGQNSALVCYFNHFVLLFDM